MSKAVYFIMPSEGLPDKLVKMVGDKVRVAWKSHDGNHHEGFDTAVFIDKKNGLMREITEEEYTHRYEEIFNHYIEEKVK